MKGFRTILFNVVAALPVAADLAVQVLTYPGLADVVPVQCYPYYALAVAVGNVVLRTRTNGPVVLPGALGRVQRAHQTAKTIDRAVKALK